MKPFWWAPAVAVLAGLAIGAALAGRLVSPLAGFIVFTLSGAIGFILGLAFAGLGLYRLMLRHDGARRALVTAAIPLLAGVAVLGSLLSTPGARYNDVATDLADPPLFLAGPAASLPHPDDFRAWHRQTYADLAPATLSVSTDAAFAKAKALIESKSWTITAEAPGKGLIQALARTAVFGFEDDVVVRIRASGSQSVVDLRSRSRVGRGDRGVNAARIRDFLAAMKRP
jgi:uncharacterized protein (DUF1499 family)